MKIETYTVQVAVLDETNLEFLETAIEKAVDAADEVLAAEVRRPDDGSYIRRKLGIEPAKKPTSWRDAAAKTKRKYTRRAKPAQADEPSAPVVNGNGEKVTRRVNGEGDVVETRR